MFNYVNVCYVSMVVVVTKDVVEDSDVVLVAIASLEVRMLVCLAVRKQSVHNKFMYSNRLMFVMFLFL